MTSPSPESPVERTLEPVPAFHLDHADDHRPSAQDPDAVFTGTPTCAEHGVAMVRDPDDRLYCQPCHVAWVSGMTSIEGP